MVERDPYENVVFIDEYPHLMERRRVKQALGQLTLAVNTDPNQLILFPDPEEPTPDGAA